MPLRIRRILVSVADGTAKRVTRRAGELARKSGAKVELFSVIRPDSSALGLRHAMLVQLDLAIAEARQRELEKLAGILRKEGIEVSCTVVTSDSLTESITRRLKQAPADLVAIEAHRHHLYARWFLLHSDFDLIRHCPVPLLIVKGSQRARRRPILAAIDPWHQNDKPASLDGRIVDAARSIAELESAPLHSAHAYLPLMGFVAGSAYAPAAVPISVPDEATSDSIHPAPLQGTQHDISDPASTRAPGVGQSYFHLAGGRTQHQSPTRGHGRSCSLRARPLSARQHCRAGARCFAV